MAAPTPVATTLSDGNFSSIIRVEIPAGGDTDVSATKVVDISTLTAGATGTYCHINKLWWSLDGFAVNLLFDADTDSYGATMARGTGFLDFSHLANGIPNPLATGYTGDIMMTTNGIPAADDETDDNVGFFIIEVLKK